METYKVTWVTEKGNVVEKLTADEIQPSPTGGMLLVKNKKVTTQLVPTVNVPGLEDSKELVAHIQGYISLIKLDK